MLTFFGHHGLKRGDNKQACDFRLKATDDWNVTLYAMWVPESAYYKVEKIDSTTHQIPENQDANVLNAIVLREIFRNDFDACPRLLTLPTALKDDLGNNVTIEAVADESGIGFLNVEEMVIPPNTISYLGSSSIPKSLKTIRIPAGVTDISQRAFEQAESLESITVDNDNQNYSCDEAGVLYNNNKTCVVSVPKKLNNYSQWSIPQSVEVLAPYSFYRTPFESINIPNTVTAIGAYAFCQSKLTTISVPSSVEDFIASSNGEIGSIFAICEDLTSATFSANVDELPESCFAGCSALESIEFTGGISDGGLAIGANAFRDCVKLETLTIQPGAIAAIGNDAFRGNSSLRQFEIGENCVDVQSGAFTGCSNLTLSVFESNEYYVTDEDGACLYLIEQDGDNKYGKFVDLHKLVDSQGGYEILSSLNKGELSDIPVTTLAFGCCEGLVGLKSITLPLSINKIEDRAFEGCKNLNYIEFNGSVDQYKAIDKAKDPENTPTWHTDVPCATIQCSDSSCGIDE